MKRNSTKNLFYREAFCIHNAVLNQASEGFSLLDSKNRYVGVNRAFCDLTGYSESELLSMRLVDLLVPGTTLNLFHKLTEGSRGEQRIEILRKGGAILHARLKGSSLQYDGQTYILAIVSDITSRFETANTSNRNEVRYRTLFDFAPDPIVIHDGKTILDVNPATLKALSLSHKKQMIGQDPFSLVHPEDQDLARYRLEHLIKSGQSLEAEEFRIVQHDGKERTVLAVPTPIEFDGQQAFMVNYHDITERKKTSEALLIAKEFAENLMETANTMVVAFDTEARVTTFNKFAEELTGYRKEEVLGKNWFELFVPKRDSVTIPSLFSEVLKQMPESSQNENYIRIKGGEERLISWSNNVMLSRTGEAQGVLSIGLDITERKLAEDERERALSDARIANQVKNLFIANISHEIRTPLNSILGFSDILNQKYIKILNKGDEIVFDYINNASKRLIRTVDSILNISQLEAGTIKIYPQTIDLVSIAKAVIDELRQDTEEKGLKIHLVSDLEQAIVFADEYCIVQAITNLVENAIKFTVEGEIEIEIKWHNDRLALSVMDSGIGISEEYQKQIYAPYTQESEGFTKNFQGIGLGMALTKRYVDLNDVEIKLISKAGVGTTFILLFSPYKGETHA